MTINHSSIEADKLIRRDGKLKTERCFQGSKGDFSSLLDVYFRLKKGEVSFYLSGMAQWRDVALR